MKSVKKSYITIGQDVLEENELLHEEVAQLKDILETNITQILKVQAGTNVIKLFTSVIYSHL
jgi:hypothetical protein